MAVVCILASILATLVIYQNNDMHYPLEECNLKFCMIVGELGNELVLFQSTTTDLWEVRPWCLEHVGLPLEYPCFTESLK